MKKYSLTQQHLKRHPEKLSKFFHVRIWSGEHHAWWRANGQGYCSDRHDAGIYDPQDAWKRISHCGPEKKLTIYEA